MTPERVSEWNAYYDVYVKWAALILVFMVACNYVTDSHVWLHLKTGQLIAKQSAPVTTDVFSYTEAGQPWFNIPWLFQWFHAVLYDFVYGLVPVDPTDPTANRAKAEQIAVGTLVVFDALIRLVTAWLILKIPASRAGSVVVGDVHDAGAGGDLPADPGDLDGWDRRARRSSRRRPGAFFSCDRALILFRAFFQGRGFGFGSWFRSSCSGRTSTSRSCSGWWCWRRRRSGTCWIGDRLDVLARASGAEG